LIFCERGTDSFDFSFASLTRRFMLFSISILVPKEGLINFN
jgi:hypothetical protein